MRDAVGRYPPPGAAAPGGGGARARAYLNAVQSVLEYDPVRGRPAAGGVDGYYLPPDQKTLRWAPTLANGSAVVTLAGVGGLPLGTEMVLRHQVYSLNGVSATAVTGLLVEDVTLWSVPGMGVTCTACTGVTLRRVRVAKRAWPAVVGDGSLMF